LINPQKQPSCAQLPKMIYVSIGNACRELKGPIVFLTAYGQSTCEFVRIVIAQWRLLVALAKRDLSDEYVGHNLSLSWAVIQPLFLMLVYLFVFTKIFPIKISAPSATATDAVVFLLSGIIPWLALAQVMGRSSSSLINNTSIVKQMAFPLELLPLKTLAGPLVFGATSLTFLVGYSLWITGGSILLAYIVGLPVLILLSLLLLIGLALLLSSVQVFVRDLKEFINMFVTVGLFIHPILYLPDALPAAVRPLIFVSPFSYFIFCWQDIIFYGDIVRGWAWIIATAFAAVLFMVGTRVFLASKSHFGDFL
jgi:lipopolysaccharide transport system permease protein